MQIRGSACPSAAADGSQPGIAATRSEPPGAAEGERGIIKRSLSMKRATRSRTARDFPRSVGARALTTGPIRADEAPARGPAYREIYFPRVFSHSGPSPPAVASISLFYTRMTAASVLSVSPASAGCFFRGCG